MERILVLCFSPFYVRSLYPQKKWNTNWYTSHACLTNTTPIHPLSPPVCRQPSSSFSVEPFNNTITLLCVASSSKTVDWWLASNQGKPAAEIPFIQSYGHHPQVLDPVILSVDNAIQWINCFPAYERKYTAPIDWRECIQWIALSTLQKTRA